MLKIKSLELSNYSGFENKSVFNFANKDGSYKKINVFYGPNGCGKSTGLNAIAVLSRAKMYAKRTDDDENLLLRKMQFHPDYDPGYIAYTKYTNQMEIIGIFEEDGKEFVVHIKDNDVIRNDLSDRKAENCVYIDADHPINNSKFQIPADRVKDFIELGRAIYGYNCRVEKPVSSEGVSASKDLLKEALSAYAKNVDKIKKKPQGAVMTTEEVYNQISDAKNDSLAFYQDFIIEKGNVNVHYKSMSAGEKKIATLLRNLCDPETIDKSDIVLVDNIEMHVYFKRHKKMLDKILEMFPQKQFIVTTHSGVMIDHVRERFGDDCLYDIPVIKGQPLVD